MKSIVFLSLFLLMHCPIMNSQPLAILDKDNTIDISVTDHSPDNLEQTKLDFINAFKTELANDTAQRTILRLETPPLDWGRKINDSTYGVIKFTNAFTSGFVTRLELYNMMPNHTYRLTLNGNPELVGNELLPDTVPGLNIERYYDFLFITTDSRGEYNADLGIFLKPGAYHVRFYVKDPDDWKIVLYHDYFKFRVL